MNPTWKNVKLQDIATVERGKFSARPRNDPKYYGGNIPFLQTGDVATATGVIRSFSQSLNEKGLGVSKLFPAGTLLITIAANIGDVAEVGFDFACPDSLVAIKPNKGINKAWLKYLLQTKKNYFKSQSTQNAQANINLQTIKPLKISLPSEQEQQKIAALISSWAAAIEKAERLIAVKEGRYLWLLRELINKGSENNGWKKAKLGTLFEEVVEKVGDRDLTPFSISAGIGFVSQKEKWGKDIAGRQYKNYTKLKKGEFAYNKGNSKKYACGCVYLLRDYEEICVPNVFICFRKKDAAVHSEFYEHYFIADNHKRELRKYISSGARSDGLLNLNKKDFFKIHVPFPPLEKQKFIANILSTARQEIDLHKKQLAALQKQKRGLMQKLLTGKIRLKCED